MSKFENQNGIAARIYADDSTVLSFEDRIALMPSLSPIHVECLEQLITPVWDGNLISKQTRSELCELGLAARWNGLNFCTQDGYCVLDTLGLLQDSDKFIGGKPWKSYARGK